MNKLLKELYIYRWSFLFAFLLGGIVSGGKAIIPRILQTLIDESWNATPPNKEYALYIPLLIAVIWLVCGLARFFHTVIMRTIAESISISYRRKLMEKYLKLNMKYHESSSHGSGTLISKMMNDINALHGGIHNISDLIKEPILAILCFGYLLYIDWTMTLFILVTLPFILLFTKSLSKSIRKYSHKSQTSMEALTKVLKESLDGKQIVQSYQLENEMIERFNQTADQVLDSQKSIIKREAASAPLSESVVAFAQAALFIYIGYKIIDGNMTYGNFIGYIFAIGLLQDSIKKLQNGYVKFQQGLVSLHRLNDVFDSMQTVPEADNPKPFPQDWKTITFKDLTFSYGEKNVLENIGFTVNRGEKVAFVGPSGSGKSTLINLLERFYDPNKGQILIDQTPISEFSLNDLRSQIALVSQDSFLFNDSIEYNILLGDLNKEKSLIPQAAQVANAHNFITKTEKKYLSHTGDLGQKLSGGQKQRINIARAIFKNAPILLLDEATSALDSTSEKEVQKGLDELLKGRTSFIIAHRLSTIKNVDKIIVLKEGTIVEVGDHDSLLARKGEYYSLCELQQTI